MMELEDCAFPLLRGHAWAPPTRRSRSRTPTSRCWSAPGRAARAWSARTCCSRTRKIFTEQGKALDAVAEPRHQGAGGRQPGQHQRLHRDEVGAVAAAEELHRDAAPRPQPRAVAARREERQAGRLDREAHRVGQPLADDVSRTTASPPPTASRCSRPDRRRGVEPRRRSSRRSASAARRSSRRAACPRRRRPPTRRSTTCATGCSAATASG